MLLFFSFFSLFAEYTFVLIQDDKSFRLRVELTIWVRFDDLFSDKIPDKLLGCVFKLFETIGGVCTSDRNLLVLKET